MILFFSIWISINSKLSNIEEKTSYIYGIRFMQHTDSVRQSKFKLNPWIDHCRSSITIQPNKGTTFFKNVGQKDCNNSATYLIEISNIIMYVVATVPVDVTGLS